MLSSVRTDSRLVVPQTIFRLRHATIIYFISGSSEKKRNERNRQTDVGLQAVVAVAVALTKTKE